MARKKPVVPDQLLERRAAAHPRARAGSGSAAKSAGVTRLTRTSVHCAESTVATSSSKALRWRSAQSVAAVPREATPRGARRPRCARCAALTSRRVAAPRKGTDGSVGSIGGLGVDASSTRSTTPTRREVDALLGDDRARTTGDEALTEDQRERLERGDGVRHALRRDGRRCAHRVRDRRAGHAARAPSRRSAPSTTGSRRCSSAAGPTRDRSSSAATPTASRRLAARGAGRRVRALSAAAPRAAGAAAPADRRSWSAPSSRDATKRRGWRRTTRRSRATRPRSHMTVAKRLERAPPRDVVRPEGLLAVLRRRRARGLVLDEGPPRRATATSARSTSSRWRRAPRVGASAALAVLAGSSTSPRLGSRVAELFVEEDNARRHRPVRGARVRHGRRASSSCASTAERRRSARADGAADRVGHARGDRRDPELAQGGASHGSAPVSVPSTAPSGEGGQRAQRDRPRDGRRAAADEPRERAG